MPGFCLKHIISWEIKTLLKAVCKESIKGYAAKSDRSHTGCASVKNPTLVCILHGAQHPESDLRDCLESALKNTAGVGLSRQEGLQPDEEGASHYAVAVTTTSPSPKHNCRVHYGSENCRLILGFNFFCLSPKTPQHELARN